MKLLLGVLLGFGVVLLLVLVAGDADAAATTETCSSTSTSNINDVRTWAVLRADALQMSCVGLSAGTLNVAPGAVVNLECRESIVGAAAPGPAETITVKGFADSASFNAPAGTAIWTRTFTNSCAGPSYAPITVYCTVDGTSSGAPSHGLVRIMVRAQRTSVPAYDVNSDVGTWGVYRCMARLSTVADGNPTSSPSNYVGGDTLRTTTSLTSTPYSTGNSAQLDLLCASSTQSVGAAQLGTGTTTLDKQISGTFTAWPDDCTITQRLTLTKKSGISGLSSLDWTHWDQGSTPPAGATYASTLVATRATKTLDRTPTFVINTWAGPACSGNGGNVFIIASDLMAINEGPVRNARNEIDTSAKTFARSYVEAASGVSLGDDSATGITADTSPCHTKSPQAPASTTWTISATVTNVWGDTATVTKSVTFLSPYSAPYHISILSSDAPAKPGKAVTMQLQTLRRSESTHVLEPYAPDQPPAYRVEYLGDEGQWRTFLPTTTAVATGLSPNSYWVTFTIPGNWPAGRPMQIVATANMTGISVSSTEAVFIANPEPDDPATLTGPSDVVVGDVVNVTVHLQWDNGTARAGAATNVSIYVLDPAGAWIINGGHPTELQTPAGAVGYYWITFNASREGNYTVLGVIKTNLAETRSPPALQVRANGSVLAEVRGARGDLTSHDRESNADHDELGEDHAQDDVRGRRSDATLSARLEDLARDPAPALLSWAPLGLAAAGGALVAIVVTRRRAHPPRGRP